MSKFKRKDDFLTTPACVSIPILIAMSIHQPYPHPFNQFRNVYLGPSAAPSNGVVNGRVYPIVTSEVTSGATSGQPNRHDAAYYESFYGDYISYLSPYQHPYAMQQVNAAANNWFLDAMGKVPWNQIVPSWTEVIRMSVRSAQDGLKARMPKWGWEQPKEVTFRAATTEAGHFLGRLA